MNAQHADRMVSEILDVLLREVSGYDEEHKIIKGAVAGIAAMGGRGGSSRSIAESGIVDLIKEFDTTRDRDPWPLSAFMLEREAKATALEAALKSCINAHESGRYESMVKAVDSAKKVLSELENA